jgi:hypothetical protein
VFGFLLKNNYRPLMLRQSFDFVIGNPPWLTVGDIATGDYKRLVVTLAAATNIAPRDIGEQSHTELATIFLAQAVTELLAPNRDSTTVRIGLVMPRSLFTAVHHRLLRTAMYSPQFKVRELWDLDEVEPLFGIPACALFASTEPAEPTARISGRVFAGRLPRKDVSWTDAEAALAVDGCEYQLAFLGTRSAWVRVGAEGTIAGTLGPTTGGNMYEVAFEQGAILYPQTLMIVTGTGALRRRMGSVAVHTDPHAAASAKLLKNYVIRATVESDNLYSTAAAEHILPYAITETIWTVVLPTAVDPGNADFKSLSPGELRQMGRVETSEWLETAERQWEGVRKEDETESLHEHLDYLRHLSAHAGQQRHIVLFASSAARPIAASFDRTSLALPFVARDGTYWASFSTQEEADFLCAFLNADWVGRRIEEWQTRGLFGRRHVHKRPLAVDWPEFNRANADHVALSAVSARLRQAAHGLLATLPARGIGTQRTWLRRQLPAADLAEVERLAQAISEARTQHLVGIVGRD